MMGKLLEIIGWIGIALFTLIAGGFILVSVVTSIHAQCSGASEDALRVLVPVVVNEKHDLAVFGKVGDIDARLRSEHPNVIGLNHYHIVVQRVSNGYDAAVKPTGWCFCRETYVLHDAGDRLEILPAYF